MVGRSGGPPGTPQCSRSEEARLCADAPGMAKKDARAHCDWLRDSGDGVVKKPPSISEALMPSRRIPDRRCCLGRNWGRPELQLSESSDVWIVVACSAVEGWRGRPDCRTRLENESMSPRMSST